MHDIDNADLWMARRGFIRPAQHPPNRTRMPQEIRSRYLQICPARPHGFTMLLRHTRIAHTRHAAHRHVRHHLSAVLYHMRANV